MTSSFLSLLCGSLLAVSAVGAAPAAEENFFSAVAAAGTEEETEHALTLLLSTPVPQQVCAEVVRQPSPVPFAKLSRQEINISKSWISSAEALTHVTDECLARFSEQDYPRWQKALEKLSKHHKVVQTDFSLFQDYTGVQEICVIVNKVYGSMLNSYREETGADYVGMLVRPVGKVDWAKTAERMSVKVEVSLYDIPIEYREAVRQGKQPENGRQESVLNLETGSGELVNSTYFYTPMTSPILTYDDGFIINPMCMRFLQGYYQEHSMIRRCEMPAIGLPDNMLKRAAELRYVPAAPGKDYVGGTYAELLDKMAAEGVLPAERIEHFRRLSLADLFSWDSAGRSVPQVLLPLGFSGRRVENYMPKAASVPRNARIMAELGYLIAALELSDHFGSLLHEHLDGIDARLPLDVTRTRAHMMLTSMNLMGYGPFTEKDLLEGVRYMKGAECSGLGTWVAEKGILLLNYPLRTEAVYPAEAPDWAFRVDNPTEEKLHDAKARQL